MFTIGFLVKKNWNMCMHFANESAKLGNFAGYLYLTTYYDQFVFSKTPNYQNDLYKIYDDDTFIKIDQYDLVRSIFLEYQKI